MKLLADILGGIIGIATIYYFYNQFLSQQKISKQMTSLLYLLIGIYGILYPIFVSTPLLRSICSIIYVILPLVLYKDKLHYKIVIAVTYFIIFGLSELLIKAIFLGFLGDFFLFYQAYEYHYLLGVICSNSLSFILIYFFSVVISLSKQHLPLYLYMLLFATPTVTVLLFYYLQKIVYQINEQSIYIAYCYICFILLAFNLFFIFMISQISQTSWLKAKLKYEESLIQEQQEYHKSLAVYHQKVRQLSHDINNHLLIIYHALLEKDLPSAMQHIEEQIDTLSRNKMFYTGLLLLDTILECKKQLSQNQFTQYTVYTEMQQKNVLSEEQLKDFSIMLASCIDNALEATAKIAVKEERWIKITLKYSQPYLYCKIENSVYSNVLIKESQLPISTKSNTWLHGLGLENVKKLSEKYGGRLALNCEDNVFTTQFSIKSKELNANEPNLQNMR